MFDLTFHGDRQVWKGQDTTFLCVVVTISADLLAICVDFSPIDWQRQPSCLNINLMVIGSSERVWIPRFYVLLWRFQPICWRFVLISVWLIGNGSTDVLSSISWRSAGLKGSGYYVFMCCCDDFSRFAGDLCVIVFMLMNVSLQFFLQSAWMKSKYSILACINVAH